MDSLKLSLLMITLLSFRNSRATEEKRFNEQQNLILFNECCKEEPSAYIVQVCLENSADPNYKDNGFGGGSSSLLHEVCQHPTVSIPVLRLLLDHRADPNYSHKGSSKNTVLTTIAICASENMVDGMKLLLKAKADPNVKEKSDHTALHMLGCAHPSIEAAQLLIRTFIKQDINGVPSFQNFCKENEQARDSISTYLLCLKRFYHTTHIKVLKYINYEIFNIVTRKHLKETAILNSIKQFVLHKNCIGHNAAEVALYNCSSRQRSLVETVYGKRPWGEHLDYKDYWGKYENFAKFLFTLQNAIEQSFEATMEKVN